MTGQARRRQGQGLRNPAPALRRPWGTPPEQLPSNPEGPDLESLASATECTGILPAQQPEYLPEYPSGNPEKADPSFDE